MARLPLTEPRKLASQARAQATVDALVKATAHILVKSGYERATTNKIAQAAGVSIGSLYQYFPSKEALVAAVIDRHQHEMMQLVRGALTRVGSRPVRTAVREIVKVMIDAHRLDPKLHRVLVEQTPRVGRLENVAAFERESVTLVGAYLRSHREELAVTNLELAAFVCVTAVEALTHAAVVDRANPLTDEEVNELVAHVTRLVVRYIADDT
jgi:AcrR family transcriptional regulator